MAVQLKQKKQDATLNTPINFKKESHKAVEGLKGSFFEGKIKVVHEVQADKLVAAGFAKIVKSDLEEVKTNNRINVDAPTED